MAPVAVALEVLKVAAGFIAGFLIRDVACKSQGTKVLAIDSPAAIGSRSALEIRASIWLLGLILLQGKAKGKSASTTKSAVAFVRPKEELKMVRGPAWAEGAGRVSVGVLASQLAPTVCQCANLLPQYLQP